MSYTAEELNRMAVLDYPGGNPTLNYGQESAAYEMYDGKGDMVLDFSGDENDIYTGFQLKGHKNRQFTMVITNTDAAPHQARLYGGYNQFTPALVPGLVSTGAFNDTAGNPGLSGASGNAAKTIEEFLNFILFNPTRIAAVKIDSDASSQVNQVLTIDTLTPFRATTNSKEIYPSNEQNEYTFQNNISVMSTEFQLSNQENALYTIVPNSSVNITFFAGASYNTAMALQRKAKMARATLGSS